MNIPSPVQVASARTARLVAEAATPVFVSTREGQAARERADLLRRAEVYTMGDHEDYEWCSICSRATNHFGEHSEEQLLAWARTPLGRLMLGR